MSTRNVAEIRSLEDLESVADYLGSHFFDKETMRSFGTRRLSIFNVVSPGNLDGMPAIGYFATSEKSPTDWVEGTTGQEPRQFVVRRYVVKQSDEWEFERRHDVIEFDTIIAHLPDRGSARSIALLAAEIERSEGYERVEEYVDAFIQRRGVVLL